MRKRRRRAQWPRPLKKQRARDKRRPHTDAHATIRSLLAQTVSRAAFRRQCDACDADVNAKPPIMQPPMQRARARAAGRSGVNSLWSPALKATDRSQR